MKKILFCAKHYFPPLGGGEYFILSVLKYLKEKGYSCIGVCYVDPETNRKFNIESFLEWQGIPVIQTNISNVMDIRKIYEDVKPDLLITQSFDAPLLIDAAKGMGIKTILGTHFWRNICAVDDNFQNMLNRPIESVKILKHFHRAFFRADEVYVNSEFMQKAVERYVGKKVERIIHPIIDIDRVLYSGEKKEDFVTIINPDHGKGGGIFADIAQKMRNTKFLSVGLAPNIIPENRAINARLSGLNNVKIIEKTDNMKEIYAMTKILLVPSLVDETFSMVTVEAMANGIPVIATPNGNLPFLVKDGGFVLGSDDISPWVDVIKELLSNNSSYTSLSSGAKNNSLQYDPNVELEKFYNMVKTCIGEN